MDSMDNESEGLKSDSQALCSNSYPESKQVYINYSWGW